MITNVPVVTRGTKFVGSSQGALNATSAFPMLGKSSYVAILVWVLKAMPHLFNVNIAKIVYIFFIYF